MTSKIDIRKQCKKLMAELDLAQRGGLKTLAEELDLNRSSLSMALSGYRKGAGSEALLQRLLEHLTQKIDRRDQACKPNVSYITA